MAPSNHLVNVKESTPVEFPCKTSTARPAASVYWFRHTNGTYTDYARITENITTTADYNDLSVTTSILRFVPTRLDNNTNIFCKANNSVNTTPVKPYKKRLLNVLYKADDPYISQGNEYRVIENTSSTLSCTVKGGNPTPTLVWSCNNFSSTNQAIINSHGNVTMTLPLTPSRTHEGTCTCTSTQTGFQDTTADVSLVVLYPPSKPILIVYGSSVDGDIFFIEGNSRTIKCTSYSEPLPDKYTWTGPMVAGSIDVQRLLFTNVKKIDTGEYKCSAHNTMIPSYGGPVVGFNNTVVNVIVLYPPSALYFVYGNQSGQNISNKFVDVIQGDTFNIVCKSIDGNPSPTFKWNWQNDNLSVLTVENIQDSETNATCTATNFMQETNRAVVQENISDTVYFNILVRPTIKGCGFYYKNMPTDVINLVNDKLMIMENESFTLKCSVDGKPTPTVWWNIPQGSMVSSSSITVNNLTREMKGDYVFTANSLLEPSFKDKQNVTVNKTVLVYVLYPPVVLPMNDISKQSGRRLNVVCNFTAGMPETTSIRWTRNIDNNEWNTAILNIGSLGKSDTGIYTCTSSNVMKQIGDDKSYLGQHNQSFHLDVQYEARITSFTVEGLTTENETVNENAPVRFICNAESNPTAVMTLSHDSKTLKTKISNSIEYTIAKVTCLDAGIYVCYAKNVLNGVDFVPLFVNCHPRAAKDVDENIKSDTGVTITIVFEVIAYPSPSFKWYQQENMNWILLKEDNKFSIATSAVQSNLTILSVSVEDYTNYKVIVENLYGQMEQIYTLSPYDIPDPPTNFRYIEGHTATSSIDIEWEPGYGGGLSQTFYIKYKKSSDLQWNYVQVSDNEKQKMEFSLTGLTEGTQYDIVIFASNIKGNSSESQTLIAFTKDIESFTSSGLLIGGIIGGLIGIAVLVALFVIILRRNGYINACLSNLAQKKGQDNGINKSTDETVYNNIGNDSEYEMVDQRNEPFPYSSLEQQRTPSVVDTRDEVKKEIYENMKVQAF